MKRKDKYGILMLVAGFILVGGAMYAASIAWEVTCILLLGFAYFYPWSGPAPTNVAGWVIIGGSMLLAGWEMCLAGPGFCGITLGIILSFAVFFYPWNGVIPDWNGNSHCNGYDFRNKPED